MKRLTTIRGALNGAMSRRYAKSGLMVGMALALVATLVVVDLGPRRVGSRGSSGGDSGSRLVTGGEAATEETLVEATAPGDSPDPTGPPGTAGRRTSSPKSTKGGSAAKKPAGAAPGSSTEGSEGGAGGGPLAGGSPGGGTSGGGGSPAGGGACGFAGCERSQGVTDNEIRIGVPWQDPRNNEQEYAAGQFPIRFGDVKKQALAMQDDINRRNPNGIHGRRVKVVFYPDPNNPQQGPANETEAQAETRYCRAFAEDLKVFVVATHWMGRVGAQCLADKRVLLLRTGQLIGDDTILKQVHPWVWTSPDKSNNRLWSTLVPSLKEQGYFNLRAGEAGIKVGIVVQDDPAYTRVRDLIIQKLGEAGIRDHEVFSYAVSGQTFDFAALGAAANAAAAKFRSSGVNRVFFVPSFLIGNFFMRSAEGEDGNPNPYRPRYAVDTTMQLNGPMEKGVPVFPSDPDQLNGAMGIGWKRQSDMSGMGDEPYNAREQQCVGAMEKGGEKMVDRTNPVLAMQHCETFWAFEEAAKAAGRGLNAGSLVAGLQGLGSSWESVISYGVDFGRAASRGTGDASFAHRWIQYNFNQKRFVYQGGVRPDR